jgi:hypothetical protein
MKPKKTITICLACVFFLSLVTAYAEEEVPEIINFQGDPDGGGAEDIYSSAYTGEVVFQHTKHTKEYTEGCGDCHRDEEREPIKAYDPSEIFSCIECHDGEGSILYPIAESTDFENDFIENRADAIHILCINCHKKNNTEKHAGVAPEACRLCHKKRPVRDYNPF